LQRSSWTPSRRRTNSIIILLFLGRIEAQLQRPLSARKDRIDAPNPQVGRAQEWLVQVYRARCKPDKAAEWNQK